VFVVPDTVEGEKRKKPMSIPIRYLHAVADDAEWHAKELLRIATVVADRQREPTGCPRSWGGQQLH